MTTGDALPYEEIALWLDFGRTRWRCLSVESSGSGENGEERKREREDVLVKKLRAFVSNNAVPETSANYKSEAVDDLFPLLELVGSVVDNHKLILSALTTLKILSRKQQNRKTIGPKGFECLTRAIDFVKGVPTLAAECANVILNFCYEKANVEHFLGCNGVPVLAEYLGSENIQVQANTAGALQSISFHEEGRKQLRATRSILPRVIAFLRSSDPKVKARAVGALHNLSSDPETIHVIRKERGIEVLVGLLKDKKTAIAASAAGALQNVSREVASRNLIRESDAVKFLADLLCSDHLQCQVCAAGALMNVLGPEISQHPHSKQRKAFSKLISQCLTLGILYSTIFDTSCTCGPEVV